MDKLCDTDLDKYDYNDKFIARRRFEVILKSFSSSNNYNIS